MNLLCSPGLFFSSNIFNMLIYLYSLILAKFNIYIKYLTPTKLSEMIKETFTADWLFFFFTTAPVVLAHS